MTPFDFLNSINTSKKDLIAEDELCEKYYNSFIINRSLSYFNDTVMFANEMNRYASLSAKMQYDFYRHGIRPRKRFSKWGKRADDTSDVQLLMKRYECNAERAREVIAFYPEEELLKLRKQYDRGGKS